MRNYSVLLTRSDTLTVTRRSRERTKLWGIADSAGDVIAHLHPLTTTTSTTPYPYPFNTPAPTFSFYY